MKSYVVKTFGCKANLSDSRWIESSLQAKGLKPAVEQNGRTDEPSLCIINSCTVTNEADKQAKKFASRFAKENSNHVIVVTGCGAEVDPESFLKTPGVSFVVGNQNKKELVDLVLNQVNSKEQILNQESKSVVLGGVQNYSQILSQHPLDREWPAAVQSFFSGNQSSSQTRSFFKIQEGCNAFCAYCIIPYGRGPSRSLNENEVVSQIQALVSQGVQEVVLTGTNIGEYGVDLDFSSSKSEPRVSKLDSLVESILEKTSLPRLRLSSLNPVEISERLTNLMAKENRLCGHFHVSLQHTQSRILRLMKRRYRFKEVEECLERIAKIPNRKGGVFVGMDFITGYPGETEEDFQGALEQLKSLPWNRLHVFPYSEREGTPATRLPHAVRVEERVKRCRILNDLSLDRLTRYYQTLLFELKSSSISLDDVLLEKKKKNFPQAGYTANYLRVFLPRGQEEVSNQLISVKPYDIFVDRAAHDVGFLVERPGEQNFTSYS